MHGENLKLIVTVVRLLVVYVKKMVAFED